MISINQGLVSSFIILELLRNDEQLNRDCRIHVECFHNCREHGLTFTMYSYFDKDGKIKFMKDRETFCVYEHRNSDSIIINGKTNWTSCDGDLPYRKDSKWEYDASLKPDEHYKCYEWIRNKFLELREKDLGGLKNENKNNNIKNV